MEGSGLPVNRRILFVINPSAGKRQGKKYAAGIQSILKGRCDFKVEISANSEAYSRLHEQILTGPYSHIVAVGGDGTVNTVAASLTGTEKVLGIIPAGSGNGLARSLGIPMDMKEAVEMAAFGNSVAIDYGTVNGRRFFCTSGVGFDALIGERFAALTKRGLGGYIKTVVSEIFRYRSRTYEIVLDGKTLARRAFLITVANAGQYGNDFYIAPQAVMNDGLFHVVILKPFAPWQALPLLVKVLRKKAHLSGLIETYTARTVSILQPVNAPVHFDGEPADLGRKLTFGLVEGGLRVIAQKSH